jgi:uncharacterized protein (DUF427 family)
MVNQYFFWRADMTTVTIIDKSREVPIAVADLENGTFKFEGNYYFDSENVDMEHLIISDRIYVCPYKGHANWIDLQTADGVIKDIAWVYQHPKPDHAKIKGMIGFYAGNRQGTEAVISEHAGV